ncbi:MAG: RNA polymerase sigma factor [Pelagimonas sp.]|uniref:RNA polymerase sigma factor n=1 Tax=Pelagimonas sp. TaxID=2073170 RepID=UPI003D6B2AE8
MNAVVTGDLIDQRRCIPVHSVAVRTVKWRASEFSARDREGDVSADLKKDLIVLLPRLRRFARSLTRSVVEADDLVQEACLRALSRADQWDPSQPLDRWMFRITRNLWISEMRKRTVRVGQGTVPADETSELLTTQTGEDSVVTAQLQKQIVSLPAELSAVLLTVSVEGYSYAEAAELFDIPVGTVMSRVHRARKTLAKKIAEPQGVSE